MSSTKRPASLSSPGNFVEIFVDEEANREISEYLANRIRQRVHDPEARRN